jgi:hypothetical protein
MQDLYIKEPYISCFDGVHGEKVGCGGGRIYDTNRGIA